MMIIDQFFSHDQKFPVFQDDVETLFCGLSDIYETTMQFYSMIDNAFDVAEEGKEPLIGDCFEEMVEV